MRDLILQLSKSSIYSTKPFDRLTPLVWVNVPVSEIAEDTRLHQVSLWTYLGFLHFDRIFNRIIWVTVVVAAGGDFYLIAG
ncbi:hypothetical protein D4M90_28850 [Klebsiella oxytoca]|nr:hypothetical protein D4M90_28850 [Klebsiella oxytoca]